MIPEITVQELQQLQASDTAFALVDVRMPQEHEVSNLGGTLLPLNVLSQRVGELADQKDVLTVVYCRSGARSARAVQFLQSAGFSDVRNLRGGIIAWAREIEPSMPVG